MSVSEAKPEVQEKPVTKHQTQELTDLASFNARARVKLTNGKWVDVQITGRHGIPDEKIADDFNTFYRAMDRIALNYQEDIEFWSGVNPPAPSVPVTPSTPPASPNGNGNSHPNEFLAGKLNVEFKNEKAYYTVSGVDGAKFPKFPVRVWDETLDAAGIDKQLTMEEVQKGKSLIGWTAVYEKDSDGKVKKVVELRKPEFMQDPA